jgi:hypothetical protein
VPLESTGNPRHVPIALLDSFPALLLSQSAPHVPLVSCLLVMDCLSAHRVALVPSPLWVRHNARTVRLGCMVMEAE